VLSGTAEALEAAAAEPDAALEEGVDDAPLEPQPVNRLAAIMAARSNADNFFIMVPPYKNNSF
jgi:hypothetical protein